MHLCLVLKQAWGDKELKGDWATIALESTRTGPEPLIFVLDTAIGAVDAAPPWKFADFR